MLALLAGADALCLGHDIDEGHVTRVREAIVSAVRSGRLDEGRLVEAGSRVAASHAEPSPSDAEDLSFSTLGLEAARRALHVDGDVSGRGPVLVVELAGTLSVAAGPPSHDLTSVLRELGADAVAVEITESSVADGVALVAAHPRRRTVVVVRDVDRHPWQHSALAAILDADADSVVVDVGYPSRAALSEEAAARITTFGAGRASLTAAAERLLGTPPRSELPISGDR